MPDVYHAFQKGHRIMVQVQSSWFPLTDRNPQSFTDIPNAKPGDFVPASERIYHGARAASFIEVNIESKAAVTPEPANGRRQSKAQIKAGPAISHCRLFVGKGPRLDEYTQTVCNRVSSAISVGSRANSLLTWPITCINAG
jgi:hypothetical protein